MLFTAYALTFYCACLKKCIGILTELDASCVQHLIKHLEELWHEISGADRSSCSCSQVNKGLIFPPQQGPGLLFVSWLACTSLLVV
jgi:hypothetical protein